jgi:hypothetical protein
MAASGSRASDGIRFEFTAAFYASGAISLLAALSALRLGATIKGRSEGSL